MIFGHVKDRRGSCAQAGGGADWPGNAEGTLIMADYQGKKVVIIGLGLTGLSCVDFFLARG
ncbi:hypothetical protein, partial [Enterobacter kobei]|uniref:hypothetical protein n=1 Tax=Enterobacter kobei TaxID=208224 RepID=UPI003EE12309